MLKIDGFCPLTIPYHSSLITICMQNLKKIREQILKLSIGNGAHGRADGSIIPRQVWRGNFNVKARGFDR